MNLQEKYDLEVDIKRIEEKVNTIQERAKELKDKNLFRKIFSLIDLTSLDVADTEKKILGLVEKVNNFSSRYNDIPNVAAICLYPSFMPLLTKNLKDKNVKKATVGGSFPSSQTFFNLKIQEIEMALEEGADEVDIVLPVGKFLDEKYAEIFDEVSQIKEIMKEHHLKVILETGVMTDLKKIKHASFLCLEAGADFIKTSTGKNGPGASPEAVFVMCEAINEFYKKSGKAPGIKPAGGISDATTAIQYYLIVNEILGNDWINPERFRIGASRLANNLLGESYF
jgi:deoxyribose-phosphate aldolase